LLADLDAVAIKPDDSPRVLSEQADSGKSQSSQQLRANIFHP